MYKACKDDVPEQQGPIGITVYKKNVKFPQLS